MKELIGILQSLSIQGDDDKLRKYARRTLAILGLLGNEEIFTVTSLGDL